MEAEEAPTSRHEMIGEFWRKPPSPCPTSLSLSLSLPFHPKIGREISLKRIPKAFRNPNVSEQCLRISETTATFSFCVQRRIFSPPPLFVDMYCISPLTLRTEVFSYRASVPRLLLFSTIQGQAPQATPRALPSPGETRQVPAL